MLLSDAIKKSRKKASKQTSAPTPVAPPPTPVAPPPVPVATAPDVPTTAEVTSFLRAMTTTVGGGIVEVQPKTLEDTLRYVSSPMRAIAIRSSWKGAWIATPRGRARLDHYVGKNYRGGGYSEGGYSEKAQEYAWEYEYAMPLETEVQDKLDARFGKGLFSVDIGEKGYITVTRT